MTSCSGECCVCACNTCLAGTGDDDFYPAKADQIIRRLEKGEFSSRRQYMIDYLLSHYGYVYIEPERKKKVPAIRNQLPSDGRHGPSWLDEEVSKQYDELIASVFDD